MTRVHARIVTIFMVTLLSTRMSVMEARGPVAHTQSFGLWKRIKNSFSKNRTRIPAVYPQAEVIGTKLRQAVQERNLPYFLVGASTSEHQGSVRCNPNICSWSRFAHERGLPQPSDPIYVMNWWDHYRSYIDYLVEELQLNAIRFSVEWALVQPERGAFDGEVLAHYADLFCYLLKRGVTPIVCFHHYSDPCWFLDDGGFETEKSAFLFGNFCTRVYEALLDGVMADADAACALTQLAPKQPLFATFNSPEGYAFKGYREMSCPPADPKKRGLSWALTVLKNMMAAHVQAYYALKTAWARNGGNEAGIPEPQIGFLKNIHQLDPARNTWMQMCALPLSKVVCSVGNMVQNRGIYDFFTNGLFDVYIPGAVHVRHEDKRAIGALDWIGLNYYSNRQMYMSSSVQEIDPDCCTDNAKYRIYPHGLYRAIAELSDALATPLEIPVVVTENGIATEDAAKRDRFYRAYLTALTKAVRDGYPVHGYLTWTAFDNYEWPSTKTYSKRTYGLCSIDPENTASLSIKEGARGYQTFVKAFHEVEACQDRGHKSPEHTAVKVGLYGALRGFLAFLCNVFGG